MAVAVTSGAVAVVEAVGRVPRLLAEVEALVAGVSGTVGTVDGLVAGVAGTVGTVDVILGRADVAVAAVDGVLATGQHAVDSSAVLIASATGVTEGARTLVDDLAGPLERLLPTLTGLADTVDRLVAEHGVNVGRVLADALPVVLPRVPRLLDQLEGVVVPDLEQVARDLVTVRDLVVRLEPSVYDLQVRLAGLPGAALLKRRGSRDAGPGERGQPRLPPGPAVPAAPLDRPVP